jgi:aminodeoxyfutalosine synthase
LPPTLEDTLAAIRQAKPAATEVIGFSLAGIIDRNWGALRDVLAQLAGAGLTAIAEAPLDCIADMPGALQAAAAAGLRVECLSLQKPWPGSRTDYVLQARAIVEQFPSIQTVAPLPREQSIAVPTTGYDDVRAVALARLGLPAVKRVQVDWSQYGPKLAQVALAFGANDLDRVSTVDDESLGRRRTSVEDVRRNVAAAGFTAIER